MDVMRYQILPVAMVALLAMSVSAWASPNNSRSRRGNSDVRAPRAAVVAIMADAGQALLWDGKRDEYVVVREGDRFHQYRISSIDRDQVVLSTRNGKQQVVLPRTSDTSDIGKGKNPRPAFEPDRSAPPTRDRGADLLDPYPASKTSSERIGALPPDFTTGPVTTVSAARKKAAARRNPGKNPLSSPLDPYAGIPSVSASRKSGQKSKTSPLAAPLDPYGAVSRGSRSQKSQTKSSPLTAPLDPYGSVSHGSRSQKSKAKSPLAAPLDPYASTRSSVASPLDPYGASKPASKPKCKPKTIRERHKISRREFDSAVSDFHALSKEVQFALVGQGVLIQGISRGSLFYRWGFRDKDIILDVDGKAIRDVNDAASVYAELMDAKRFKVKVKRGIDTVHLQYRFKK